MYQNQNIAPANPGYSGVNPFYTQANYPPQQQPLEASFQDMQLQQATLTPEATGGWQQQPIANNPFLQSYTPPISPPPPPQAYNQSAAQMFFGEQINNGQINQSSTNPFMHLTRSQPMPNSPMQNGSFYDATYQPPATSDQFHLPLMSPSTNPFYSHSQVSSPAAMQQHQQYFPHMQQQQQQQSSWPDNTIHTDTTNTSQQNQPAYTPEPQEYQPAQQPYQKPARYNKSSILALYGQPHLAPARPVESTGAEEIPIQNLKRRSVTMPITLPVHTSGSKNPFAGIEPQKAGDSNGNGGDTYRSHSPDAFRSLSSTFK